MFYELYISTCLCMFYTLLIRLFFLSLKNFKYNFFIYNNIGAVTVTFYSNFVRYLFYMKICQILKKTLLFFGFNDI